MTASATFYHQATPATTYWRCELPARNLPGKLLPAHELELVVDDARNVEFPNLEGDAAVVQFPGDQGTALVLQFLQAQGKKLIVEVDDLYLSADDALWAKRAVWGEKIGSGRHTNQGHTWITRYADAVIVTTPELAKRYREVNLKTYICRNSIDPTDWPELEKPDDGVFRIGWYASTSHDRDEAMVRHALSWASRQPGVEVVTLGLDPGWGFSYRRVPWKSDFAELRRELMRLDVGVAPLVGTPSSRYRSDLKALEYAMAGAAPILQGYPPYDEWCDKSFARIASSEKEWDRAIQWAVKHRDEARAMALGAREYVLRERTFSTEINRWREAIEGGGR